jgi:hypothetical protein
VPNRNFSYSILFNVDLKRRNCPSAKCASAANALSRGTGTFNGESVYLLISCVF